MKKEDKFTLSKEVEDRVIEEIKKFFFDVRDEEVSNLEAMLVLDFIKEKVAAEFYNKGVYDAYSYTQELTEEIMSLQKY